MSTEVRGVPMFPALVRPHLVRGSERAPLIMWSLICGTLIGPGGFLAHHYETMALGLLLLVVGIRALRWLAKKDPQAVEVAFESLRYRSEYAAWSRWDASDAPRLSFRRLLQTSLVARGATPDKPGFDMLLKYQALVGDGVWLLKDAHQGFRGPLLAGYWYRGRDLEGAPAEALGNHRHAINSALKHLDAGCVVHVVALRVPEYLFSCGVFEEAADQLIEEERAANAYYYVNVYGVFITQSPNVFERRGGRALKRFLVGEDDSDRLADTQVRIQRFEAVLTEFEASLGAALTLRRMRTRPDNDELLQAMNLIVNGVWKMCPPPSDPRALDVYLAHEYRWNLNEQVHGNAHVAVVGLVNLPERSVPTLMTCLASVDTDLMWSSRFILMDYGQGHDELKAMRRKWADKIQSMAARALKIVTPADQDAVERTQEVDEALALLESHAIRYGHYTSTFVLRGATQEEANGKARRVMRLLEERGFEVRLESIHRTAALLSSYPGHNSENVRRPFINTLNFADLIPILSEWTGSPTCPSPLYPANSPALLQARSWTGGPFFWNAFSDSAAENDLANALMAGTPGAGKSLHQQVIYAQHLRYPGSRVVAFDRGGSLVGLASARVSGRYYTFGADIGPRLCPLGNLETEQDKADAARWLGLLCTTQGRQLTDVQRTDLYHAVCEFSASTRDTRRRSLTSFLPHTQMMDPSIQDAIAYYATGAARHILDGDEAGLTFKRFTAFELSDLMKLDPLIVAPVLDFLLREVERSFDGSPMLIGLDEANEYLKAPGFYPVLDGWLRRGRKANIWMLISLQVIDDATDSEIAAAIGACCPTKILLPIGQATQKTRDKYKTLLGLNDAQVDALERAEKKRWYMHYANGRSRLYTLDVGPVQMALCGATSVAEQQQIKALIARHGSMWPATWLEKRGAREAAARFRQLRTGPFEGLLDRESEDSFGTDLSSARRRALREAPALPTFAEEA